MDTNTLLRWVKAHLNDDTLTLHALHGDASRRRYFRTYSQGTSWIVADASAELTDVMLFVWIDELFAKNNIHVPLIKSADINNGYLILEDFGDDVLLNHLTLDNVNDWYQQAFSILLKIQAIKNPHDGQIFYYDENSYRREWGIFTHWYLEKYQHFDLIKLNSILESTFQLILKTMVEQPQVLVHRDFHSRNLMQLADKTIGVIDFQGAKWGAITYDLVSLLRDCYIDWPQEQVEQWVNTMRPLLCRNIGIDPVDNALFMRWFDFSGLQRHLKVLGQFARKSLNEGNNYYIKDLPRVRQYVLAVCERYPELSSLAELVRERV